MAKTVYGRGGVKFKNLVHMPQELFLPKWYEGQVGWDNATWPDVYVLDSTAKYPVGMGYRDGGKFFIYSYCASVSFSGNRAMGGMMNVAQEVYETAKAVAHVVGETEIVIVDSSSAVNLWAGGTIMPRVHPYSHHRILKSTAHDGTNVTLTLERGLLTELASGGRLFLNQHPYKKLESMLPNSGDEKVSAMGVNLVQAVAGRWMWVQTWGECYVTGGDELLGKSNYVRMGYFHIDGTLYSPAAGDTLQQDAGFAIPKTSASLATWHVYLQIAHY